MDLTHTTIPKFSILGIFVGSVVGSTIFAGASASYVIWLDSLSPGNSNSDPLSVYLVLPFLTAIATAVLWLFGGILHKTTSWKLTNGQAFLVAVSFCTFPLAFTGYLPFVLVSLVFNPVCLFISSVRVVIK